MLVLLAALTVEKCVAQEQRFEAAAVKPASSGERYSPMAGGPGTSDPGRVRFVRVNLATLVSAAYGVQPDQVSGPGWAADPMGPDKYDVVATMAPDTTKEQFRAMLQRLLVERFELLVRHETRAVPGYALLVGKGGPRITDVESASPGADSSESSHPVIDAKSGWPTLPTGPHSIRFMPGGGRERAVFQDRAIAEFVGQLASMIGNSIGSDPTGLPVRVVDKTGLGGKYTFRLEYSCARCRGTQSDADTAQAGPRAEDPLGIPNIFGALEKQLGLKLEKTQSVRIDFVVIEKALKVPTPD